MGRDVLLVHADGPRAVSRSRARARRCPTGPPPHEAEAPSQRLSPPAGHVCAHRRLAGGYSEKQIRMGERAFGNLHEQSTIFLAAVWLHALFVDAGTAATLGWAWLGFRFAYVAIWALTAGNIMPAILLATMPMYGIIIWLFATVSTMRSRCQLLSLSLSLSLSLCVCLSCSFSHTTWLARCQNADGC